MASHEHHATETVERRQLGERAGSLTFISFVIGVIGIVAAVGWGFYSGSREFFFSYLVSFAFFLSIALGALFFVLMQHMARAGWSVNVRRVAEGLASTIPVLGLLAIPILFSVLKGDGGLYRWAQPVPAHHEEAEEGEEPHATAEAHGTVEGEHAAPGHEVAATPGSTDTVIGGRADNQALYKDKHPSADGIKAPDELTLKKRPYLNPPFFVGRMIFYFVAFSVMALWYAGHSKKQDVDHDPTHTVKMERWAARCVLAFALIITALSFDMVMSLDPHWYSTMFGVYYFSGGMVAFFATFIILLRLLQANGYLKNSITVEHYHDIGKWQFAFVFFWGYIAFSQYMLIWYASLPEEVFWFSRRGATTAVNDMNPWGLIICIVVVGQLLLPFPGLLSRHVKRSRFGLPFWASWLLVFHFLDMLWCIVPELDGKVHFGVGNVASFIGIGGLFFAAVFRALGSASLIPAADPRIEASLAFHNM